MSEPPRFTFVTGNAGKLAEARRLCPLSMDSASIDLPEIQSLSLEAVAREKAEEAWRRLERPIVVEETGLELAALNGFPGPLVRWMQEAVGPAGIAHAASTLGDTQATARCLLLFRDTDRSVLAEGTASGRLVEPRGEGGFGWDAVFQPDGADCTFAELSAAEKDALSHRGHAWRRLVETLTDGAF